MAGLAVAAGTAYEWRESLQAWIGSSASGVRTAAAPVAVEGVEGKGKAKTDGKAKAQGAGSKGDAGGRGRGGGGSAPVTAATAQEADMPVVLSAPGTVEPLATVAIKPRVDGQVNELGFAEGDLVKEGQVLFRLDDRLVKAQIRQAEANIAKDQASLKDAEAILERRQTLFQKQYASEAATETARQQVESLKASIAAGHALLEAQRTQLDYLAIRAPITGRTGNVSAKIGAMVRTNDPTALVTINQTRPIAVTFALPQVDLPALRTALTAKSPAEVTVPGEKPIKLQGQLSFVDNQVDKQTGTVMAKIQVRNEDETLWPGLAVGVELTVEIKHKMVSVPASAVLPAQQGMIVWVIGADDRVSVRTVTVDRIMGQTAFLARGLEAGERVVTDGQLRLAPGGLVTVQSPDRRAPPAADAKNERRADGRS